MISYFVCVPCSDDMDVDERSCRLMGKKRQHHDAGTSTDGLAMPARVKSDDCEDRSELLKRLIGFTTKVNVPQSRDTDESFEIWYPATWSGTGEIEVRGHNGYGQLLYTTVKAPKIPKWGDSGEDI